MDKLKQWVSLSLAAVVVIAAGGWFLLISPKRSEAAALRTQAQEQVTANSALNAQLQVLKAQEKGLVHQQAQVARVNTKIPDNPSLPSLIRALDKAAIAAGVELVSIAPTPATPVANAAASTGAPKLPAAATSIPRSGTAGQLETIGVTLNVVGGYYHIQQFLDGIESLQRAMKVVSFGLAPGANPLKPGTGSTESGKSLTASITGAVYMAAGRSSLPKGAQR